MKVKPPQDAVSVSKFTDDLFKLGFCGGELHPNRKKVKELHFSRMVKGPLVQGPHGARRLSSRTELIILVTVNGKEIAWDYETVEEQKLAISSGMHSKLATILGSQK